ncbi:TPA: outer membrane protein assembly factor BamA, partial [Candidatus Poribacteria bacterium]|nr:outer membrane protein assembly factor BamA [Candidatus Poribacteria bacterium]
YPITKKLRINLGYTFEKIEISTDLSPSDAGPAYYNLENQGFNSALNLSLNYDTRNNRLFPSAGMYHMVSGEFSDKLIGSDENMAFRRFKLLSRFYYSLPWSFVLKFNASFGYIFAPGGREVPPSERFFPGGIYSVRGYEPMGLGTSINVAHQGNPMSPTFPFILGGNKEIVLNLELEFPILKAAQIKGVLFADAGNAYDERQNFFYIDTPDYLKGNAYTLGSGRRIHPPLGLFYSLGFGVRWLSPVGPLRFEWGIPLVKRYRSDPSILFEFTIGNFF